MRVREKMIKEIVEYHTSIGRVICTEEQWNKVEDETIFYYHESIGIEPIPKDQLINFYESIANSELGYSREDRITANGGFPFSLNTYQAWESWNYDIKQLGEDSCNYGKDFKEEMAKKYEIVKKSFI